MIVENLEKKKKKGGEYKGLERTNIPPEILFPLSVTNYTNPLKRGQTMGGGTTWLKNNRPNAKGIKFFSSQTMQNEKCSKRNNGRIPRGGWNPPVVSLNFPYEGGASLKGDERTYLKNEKWS